MFVFNDRWRTSRCAACSADGRARALSCLNHWRSPMKHALRAVIAIALGAGLAVAAQAHGTIKQQSGLSGNQQSGMSGSSTQSAAPTSDMQTAAPAKQTKRAATKIRHPSTQREIRQVQLRLKSEGLFKGRVTGRMDQQTRIGLNRFEKQNGLPRTASLNRVNRLMANQTAGSGSSMQRTHIARAGSKMNRTHLAHAKVSKTQTTGV